MVAPKCIEKGVTLCAPPATRLLLEDGRIAGVGVRERESAQQVKVIAESFSARAAMDVALSSFALTNRFLILLRTTRRLKRLMDSLWQGNSVSLIRNIPTSLSSMVGYWIPRPGGEPEFHSAGIQDYLSHFIVRILKASDSATRRSSKSLS